ncbi:hypothetical protein VN21_11225 [Paraclostridium benzoelyticum]|uniref:Uncharacterized protein n=1 Tax=Paraclostridium benzoelyticum TaxID=1629550 RepID=A0A0M3DFU3_9FIRM|nr:hypothetical protein VN21_11225 [Paraclostridium benzoelyticum]
MSIKSLAIFEILIGFIIIILSALRLFEIIEIPIIIINLLFITTMSVLTWINYKNNKKVSMFIGILIIFILIGFIILSMIK